MGRGDRRDASRPSGGAVVSGVLSALCAGLLIGCVCFVYVVAQLHSGRTRAPESSDRGELGDG